MEKKKKTKNGEVTNLSFTRYVIFNSQVSLQKISGRIPWDI